MNPIQSLSSAFDDADARLMTLEIALREGHPPPLTETVDTTIGITRGLLRAFAASARAGQAADPVVAATLANEDVLEVFKGFVKGDPSLNAVRDNIRELVFYRNCLAMGREDALPTRPEAMAVRTTRHIYLYLRTRALQAHLLGTD